MSVLLHVTQMSGVVCSLTLPQTSTVGNLKLQLRKYIPHTDTGHELVDRATTLAQEGLTSGTGISVVFVIDPLECSC